jgi:hypothetical protein
MQRSDQGGRGGVETIESLRAASRFFLRFLELQIAMALGALGCYLLGRLISDSSGLATTYHPGTYLFAIGDVLFLTFPVMAWMLSRRRGWRCSFEMALAMLVPVAIITIVGELARYPYLLWLVTGMYPAMSLGMILDMLYRRGHLTARVDASDRMSHG